MAFSAHIRRTLPYSPSQKSAKLIELIFGLVAGDELALRLGQVERRAGGLGHRAEIRKITAIGNSSGLKPKPLRKPKMWPCCAATIAGQVEGAGLEHDQISTKPIETS